MNKKKESANRVENKKTNSRRTAGKKADDRNLAEKKELALEVIRRLKQEYPEAKCTLDYDKAWQLLVSVRLAAQCTDARVDQITPKLYEKFPSVAALAEASPDEIGHRRMRSRRSCGPAALDRAKRGIFPRACGCCMRNMGITFRTRSRSC